MKRLLRRVLVIYLVASAIAGIALGEFALQRGRWPGRADAEARARAVAAAHGARLEPARLLAADGVPLAGWMFTHDDGTPRPTVLVAHGSAGSRDHATAYAEFLLQAGFDVLAPDARGHGESGGVTTYGVREADDLRRWAAWTRAQRPGTCLYGLGTSLGAAEILMAEGAHPTFCAIVSDASYATFLDAGLDRIARVLSLGEAGRWIGRPAAYAGLASVRLLHGVNLLDASPVDAIAHAQASILLIHGDADRNSPVYHTRALAAAQPRAEVWIVPGAAHDGCWRAEPQAYPQRIVAFFRAHGSAGPTHG
jgi:fermentation-respiration switch protein FrsA (DUF1100 family)